jgi:hypothetical protein
MTNLPANSDRTYPMPSGGVARSVAPSGRLIRSAKRPIIPHVAPSNTDVPRRKARHIIRRGTSGSGIAQKKHSAHLFGMVCAGFLIGTLSSLVLFLPSGPLPGVSSRRLLAHLKTNLSEHQTTETPRGFVKASLYKRDGGPNFTRTNLLFAAQEPSKAVRHNQATKHVVEQSEPLRTRLAAFVTTPYDPSEKPKIETLVMPLTKPREVQRPIQVNAVRRVYSIIKKYAPKHRNPEILARAIVAESNSQNYDPLFVAAVIKAESAFNTAARSHKGAQGLMQIMPATGAWLAKRNDLPRGSLTDPGHNLRLGITYLKQLEADFSGDKVFALVAYNWGPGHVQSAAGGKRRIPKECISYALKILHDYRRWNSGYI